MVLKYKDLPELDIGKVTKGAKKIIPSLEKIKGKQDRESIRDCGD